MVRIAILILALLCTAGPAAADPETLPLPPALEPNVAFWLRIYTEVDGQAGLIHDAEYLDVVYEVARFPGGLSSRARQREVERIKKRYRSVLYRLAKGKREDLSEEEARVLAIWPEGTSNATLSRAANQLRFQLGQADRFRAGLIRSGRWSGYVEGVLLEHGVPRELVALPHVESSYNPRAYSRVGAAGIWQFTRSTGRRYLRVDHVVDERMDPFAATVGAARLLRDNYRRIESWPLAITAYNHGVGGMAQAVRKVGTRDIGEISRRYKGRTFGFASRNFYSEFLAASEVDSHPERYFGAIQPDPPLAYEIVETDAYYKVASLTRALGIETETLHEHNLALRPSIWNGAKLVPKGYQLRLPQENVSVPLETALASIPAGERKARQHRDRFHKVRRGEALSVIARRYGVSQSELVALNNLRSRHRIRAGQVLRLPDDGSAPVMVARSEPPSNGIYTVRRGDNLSIISARFGASQSSLVKWNRLRNRNRLYVGQRLRVAAPVAVVASATQTASDAVPAAPSTPPPAPEPVVLARVDARANEPAVPEPAAPEPADESDDHRPVLAIALRPDVSVPDPSNYAVTADDRVTVQAEETLGHYAEWLEVTASSLRRINGMRYGQPLVIGRQKKLDFSRVTPEIFEQRRLEFHGDLQEEFFEVYAVAGTTTHVLRRGDSLWYLANRKYEVPLWLLRQYNPDLDFGSLPAGTRMVIPLIESRTG